MRVVPAKVRLATLESVTAAQLATAILEHSEKTNTKLSVVLQAVAQGRLVPVGWPGGGVTLVTTAQAA